MAAKSQQNGHEDVAVEDMFPPDVEISHEEGVIHLTPRGGRTLQEVESLLDNPLDPAVIKQRRQNPKDPNSKMLRYIPWGYVAKRLTGIFGVGKWDTQINEVKFLGGDAEHAPRGVMVTMTLNVVFPPADGETYGNTASYTNTGYSPNADGSWYSLEMAVGGATHTALKRCATALGDQFGISLYDKEEEPAAGSSSEATQPAPRPQPRPTPARQANPEADSFNCEDCGKEQRGYTDRTGKYVSVQDMYKMRKAYLCYDCYQERRRSA